MFYIDKYAPKSSDNICFHKDVMDKLKVMSQDESIPHIIFYGPEGSGKKTIIKLFLEMIYDKHANDITDSVYNVTGSGNSVVPVTIKQSNYHIIIEPNNNNFDRYLIQDVVNEYAKKSPLNVFTKKRNFKTVLINNVDNLSYYAQTSLRRTMEKYSNTCRFILWCKSLSKVIDPLRSRCFCFKIKSPTKTEIMKLLINVAGEEQINLDLTTYNKIIRLSERNIKKSLWLLQLYNYGESFNTSYDDIVKVIVDKYIISGNIKNIIAIRELLYKIMITNIPGSKIIKDILNYILVHSNITPMAKIDIVEIASKYEHRLVLCRREIMHLEAFIECVIMIIKKLI